MKKCVFAGTFDPFTLGHADTTEKCLKLFDEVVIAVADNPKKQCLLTAEERERLIRLVYRDRPEVKTAIWNGTMVELLKREQTPFYVRGVRNAVDFEYENADFFASRKLDPEMITIYIPCEQEHLHISSTIVRNSIFFHTPYEDYVPKPVFDFLSRKFS